MIVDPWVEGFLLGMVLGASAGIWYALVTGWRPVRFWQRLLLGSRKVMAARRRHPSEGGQPPSAAREARPMAEAAGGSLPAVLPVRRTTARPA